jgi:hypothetical protein
LQVKVVVKLRHGILSFHLGEGDKRRKVGLMGGSRVTENHREGRINRRAMGRKGINWKAEDTMAMMSMKVKEEEVMSMKAMVAEDIRKSFMKDTEAMMRKAVEGEEGAEAVSTMK